MTLIEQMQASNKSILGRIVIVVTAAKTFCHLLKSSTVQYLNFPDAKLVVFFILGGKKPFAFNILNGFLAVSVTNVVFNPESLMPSSTEGGHRCHILNPHLHSFRTCFV